MTIDFFDRLAKYLGITTSWADSGWWMLLDTATAKVNMCRAVGSETTGLRPLLMHSVFENYIRENIECIETKDDFDIFVKQFHDKVTEFIDKYGEEHA